MSAKFSIMLRPLVTAVNSSSLASSFSRSSTSTVMSGSCASNRAFRNASESSTSAITSASVSSLSTSNTSTAMSVLAWFKMPSSMGKASSFTSSSYKSGCVDNCVNFLMASSRSTSLFKNLSGSSENLILNSWLFLIFLSSCRTIRFNAPSLRASMWTSSAWSSMSLISPSSSSSGRSSPICTRFAELEAGAALRFFVIGGGGISLAEEAGLAKPSFVTIPSTLRPAIPLKSAPISIVHSLLLLCLRSPATTGLTLEAWQSYRIVISAQV
mmetsp:Transcript_13275/g.30211  ORF Transcript_13275/g.30211 Transcript_13275/m.30211 type:complete len:270 (-) Transcript_13275:30-839(-)